MTEQSKPTRVVLVRHGMNDFVKLNRLAGWTSGVHLNDHGRLQAQAVAERLAAEKVAAVYSSPLERTLETAEVIAACHDLPVHVADGLGETRIGEWSGQRIEDVAKLEMWKWVQMAPSRARFPGGESFAETQSRIVAAVDTLAARHPEQTVVLVSHSDPIKLAVAYYIGLALDLFQRLVIQPASITELVFGGHAVHLVRTNDCAHLPPEPPEPEKTTDSEPAESTIQAEPVAQTAQGA